MKKIINIFSFILLIILYYFTKNTNMFLLTISFSMYLLYSSIFSRTTIKNITKELYDKKYYYSALKIFEYSIIVVLIITLLLSFISYLIGILINIKGFTIVSISMCIYLFTTIIIRLEEEYLSFGKYKKISKYLEKIYNSTNLFLILITLILLYKVFNLNNYINISILYLVSIIPFIIINILLYIFIFSKNKYIKKGEENKINCLKETKKVLITNKLYTLFNVIQSSYIYFTLIILYYVLTNKYNYNYDKTGVYITNIYFYGIIFIYFIYLIIKNFYIDKFNIMISKIKNKEEYNIYNFINKIINIISKIVILLIILSKPLNNLLFNGSNINIILNVSYILFIYIIYIMVININMICNKEKNIILILIIGLLTTLIINVPMIDSFYRMGYDLISASVFSICLGLIVSIIIGIILINNKLKISLLDNFNDVLNIIYENIIYSLVLVIFTFIVKVNINSITTSILVIIFYIFITIMFYIIKKKIVKKV